MNQCKDCKWFLAFKNDMYGMCKLARSNAEDCPIYVATKELYVLPTHGCNAWEAKEVKKE